MRMFERYIGIDYSGAATPNTSLKGLRVYMALAGMAAQEVLPPAGARKYWTRQGIALWLAQQLAQDIPTIVGVDHGFSFPLRYFEQHNLAHDWHAFLSDFQHHWPTDLDGIYVDYVRDGSVGSGASRTGNPRWRRECELRCRGKSVFHFDVQGSVAKSTHAGIPWLRYLHLQLGSRLHFWPFDGWDVPVNRSVIAEAYPAVYKQAYAAQGRTPDQHDAYAVAQWLHDQDANHGLQRVLHPDLTPDERAIAELEGWILGVGCARNPRPDDHILSVLTA